MSVAQRAERPTPGGGRRFESFQIHMNHPDSIMLYFMCPECDILEEYSMHSVASNRPYCSECDGEMYASGWTVQP